MNKIMLRTASGTTDIMHGEGKAQELKETASNQTVYGSGMDKMEEPLYNANHMWQMDGDSSWDDETSVVLQLICADVLLWLFLVLLYFWNSGEQTLSVFLLLFIVKMGGVLLPFWWLFPNIYRSGHSSQVIPPEVELEDTQALDCLQSLYISNVVVLFLSIVVLHLWSKENRRQMKDIGQTIMLTAAPVISAAVSLVCSVLSLGNMLVKTPANKKEKTVSQRKKSNKKKHKRAINQPEPQPTVSLEQRDSAQELVEPMESAQEIVEPEDSAHEKVGPLYSAIIEEMLLVDGCNEEIAEVGHEDIPRAKPCMRNNCVYNEDLDTTVLTTEPTESQETEVISFPEKKKKKKKIIRLFQFIQNLKDTRKKKSGKSKKQNIFMNLTSCFRCHSVDSDDP
ncbi:uncharacterized protein LOC108715773 [Xenopus laevis]|uniref:Uncharacterized protein LOC108715773 n=1 Tax=Xenopus laevis TaxID=8355 RepID=A0A8J0V6X0_XENLA|nr:uncharacterized protein LOC108715773 [Xenopus laevis]